MNKSILLIILAILILGLGAMYLLNNSTVNSPREPVNKVSSQPKVTEPVKYFDEREWTLVKTVDKDITNDGAPEKVFLLKSVQIIEGKSEDFEQNNVRLIIVRGNDVIYDTTDSSQKNRTFFFEDDKIVTDDVTGDKIPEVLFTSYAYNPTGGVTRQHIIHFNADRNSFVDISIDEFDDSRNHGFSFLKTDGGLVPIVATLIKYVCGTCGGRFHYNIYKWDGKTFVVSQIIDGEKEYEASGGAVINSDAKYIHSNLIR